MHVCVLLMTEYKCTLYSLPTDDAWVFAKWNAIQAVGVMSFGEFVCMKLMLMMEMFRILLAIVR